MKICKLMCGLMAVTVSLVCSAKSWEIDDFVLSQSRVKTIPASQPATDGGYYYQFNNERTVIHKIAYSDGEKKKTFFDNAKVKYGSLTPVESWSGYRMAGDEKSILLWANTKSIYRYSFTADYYIYNVAKRTIEPLTADGGEEIATLSPDGGKVAFVKDNNVFVKDLRNGIITTVTTDGKKNEVINAVPDWVYQEEFGILNSFTWSAGGEYLAFIRWDESAVPMCSMQLYQGECRPDSNYAIHPGSFDYKYPAPGEPNAIVSALCYDIAAGSLKKVDVPIVESDYIPSVSFAGNNLMVTTLNRSQNHMNIYRCDPATGQAATAYDETSDMWIENSVVTGVNYYDDFFVVMSNRDGRNHLYKYDYKGNLIKQITRGAWDVTAYYGYDKKNGAFYFQSNNGALDRVIRRADDTTGEIALMTAPQGTFSATFSNDFSYYVQRFSDLDTPDRFDIVKTAGGKTVRELQHNEQYAETYAGRDIPRREFFTMENDGYTLNGYIIKPLDFDPSKQYPCIMSQYSGPGSQQVLNKWKMEWEEYFALQGYVIACVDGRGTGGQGKEFKKTIYKNLGRYETEDQVAAARYMAAMPWIDESRIGIWGWSFGGFEALMAMSQDNSPYACGVSIAPVTSWRFYDSIYTERYMLTPDENPEGYSYAPLDLAHKLSGNLLLIFGSADDNVRIVNSMQYIAKLQAQDTDFEMMTYTNMNHSINGCDIRKPLYKKVLNFFNKNLK